MYVDSQLEFSDAQAITASAASDNLVDLGATQVDLGVGEPLYLVVNVTTAFTDAGSDSTVLVEIEQDTTAAFSSATAVQTVGTFAALSAVGDKKIARLAPLAITEQFIRLQYTVANGNLTTGALDAQIVTQAQLDDVYPSGYTVS
jgi:hypothetical protein